MIADVTSAGGDDLVERLAALGEIAAETAHELRNVLAVISSSAYVARGELDRGNEGLGVFRGDDAGEAELRCFGGAADRVRDVAHLAR